MDPFGLEKFDGSKVHVWLGYIGTGAYIIGGILTITSGASVYLAFTAALVGGISAGLNTGLYINDAIEADSSDERNTYITKACINATTICTGTMVNKLENIFYSQIEKGILFFLDGVANNVSFYLG